MANSIFQRATYVQSKSRHVRGRVNLLAQDVAEELNTYKNFGLFHTWNDVHSVQWDAEGKDAEPEKGFPGVAGTPGVRSIFNKYSAVLTGNKDASFANKSIRENIEGKVYEANEWRLSYNVPLLDTPETRRKLKENSDCTIRSLVKASQNGHFGVATYSYADFMYCKYINTPNNYLITLRRFPIPILDSIAPLGLGRSRRRGAPGFNHAAVPLGTMVTWLGRSGNDMKNILKYNYKMAFKENEAKWEDVEKSGGDSGILNSMEAAFNPSARKQYTAGHSVPALDNFMKGYFNAGDSPYGPATRRDQNKIYGPIDRVKKAYGRSEAGLDWDQSFDLVFEYELQAYNGINPRQAMLDLLASIITVTYTTGGFWGGGYRGGGTRQSSWFQNLSIFKCAQKGGNFTDFMDAISQDVKTGMKAVGEKIQSLGGLVEAAKALMNALGGMLIGGLLNKMGRPAKYFANSLISDAPVGLWHITIGNPHHPIMQMGNMILTNTVVEHSGPLGIDDFPTNLKVTCSFTRGKPRDQYGIENLYMGGNDRIFHSMQGKVADMYKVAAAYKANRDTTDTPSSLVPKEVTSDTEVKASQTEPKTDEATNAGQGADTTNKIDPNSADYSVEMGALVDAKSTWLKYFGLDDMDAVIMASKEAGYGASIPNHQESPNDEKVAGEVTVNK